jgi:HSP20 family protein
MNWNLPTRRNDRAVSPFSENFSDMFDRYTRDFFSPTLSEGMNDFMPRVEVKETDKTYEVSAELPGMKEDDINVTLRENNLIIEGEKRSESKKEEKDRYRSEFQYGSFYRSIPLQADVDNNNVDANYRNGLLKVTLTKKNDGTQKNKKIKINKSDTTKH